MSKLKKIIIVSAIFVSLGFLTVGKAVINSANNTDVNYESINTDADLSSISFTEKGNMIASWYGPRFHGKLTANGEIYNQMAFTAAHKSLPFGTVLRLTNFKNGKTVFVRINDRGPYIEGRNLDLSKGAALALGMIQKGVIKVNVEEVAINSINSAVITL